MPSFFEQACLSGETNKSPSLVLVGFGNEAMLGNDPIYDIANGLYPLLWGPIFRGPVDFGPLWAPRWNGAPGFRSDHLGHPFIHCCAPILNFGANGWRPTECRIRLLIKSLPGTALRVLWYINWLNLISAKYNIIFCSFLNTR